MKQVCVTGGTGFIGSHIVERLLETCKVVVLDLKKDDRKFAWTSHKNLVRFVEGSVLDPTSCREAVEGCTEVVHLASIAGVTSVIDKPVTVMNVTLLGTSNMLQAVLAQQSREADALKCEKFIVFSTSEVYGQRVVFGKESESGVIGAVGEPRWTYAAAKLAAEHLAMSYFRQYKIPVVCLRPFNVYGPGQVGIGGVRNFVTAAIRNEVLTVYNKGDDVRAWTYVSDVVDVVCLCLERDVAGEVFNAGNSQATISTQQLAHRIVALAKSDSEVVHKNFPHPGIEVRIPSMEKVQKLLDFYPKVTLDDGLLRTIDAYRAADKNQ